MLDRWGSGGSGGTARAWESVMWLRPSDAGMSMAIAAPTTAAPTRAQTTNEANQAATLRTIVAVYGRRSAEPCHNPSVRLTHMAELVVTAPGGAAQAAAWRLVGDAQRHDPLAPVGIVVPSTVTGLQ